MCRSIHRVWRGIHLHQPTVAAEQASEKGRLQISHHSCPLMSGSCGGGCVTSWETCAWWVSFNSLVFRQSPCLEGSNRFCVSIPGRELGQPFCPQILDIFSSLSLLFLAIQGGRTEERSCGLLMRRVRQASMFLDVREGLNHLNGIFCSEWHR